MCAAPVPSAPALPSLALLESAADVLSEFGPARFTFPLLAERSGVREGVLEAVWPSVLEVTRDSLDYLGESIYDSLGPERPGERLGDLLARTLSATEHNQRFWRILSWCLLEGLHPHDLRRDYPVVQRLLRAAARSPSQSVSPEALVAGIAGAGLGLLFYGSYLQVALGQGESRWARTRSELVTLTRRMMLRAERRASR